MQASYLFYDLETSGLDKSFDQVQQFAAIRTDLDLNEIERHEIFIRINPDCIPSPEALIVHRVGIEHCQKIGLCEYEGIKRIHEILNTPHTISIGYNTLGFDDEFLRFSFFRNLLTPYTHQYANQCARADLFPMCALYRWQGSSALEWPEKDGRPSLKLELINACNDLAQGQAHNAMVDVEATVSLARRLKKCDAEWQYALGFFHKVTEGKRLQKLPRQNEALPPTAMMIDGRFGANNLYQAPVLFLGHHRHYKNQTMWLRLDTEGLETLCPENLTSTPWVIKKKQAEAPFFLPMQTRFMERMSNEQMTRYETNWLAISKQPSLIQALQEHYLNETYPEIENIALEASLYQIAFPTQTVTQQLAHCHQNELPTEAISLLPEPQKTLGHYLLARNYPERCSETIMTAYHAHCQKAFQSRINHQGKASRTLSETYEALKSCRSQTLDAQQQQLLQELETHLLHKIESTHQLTET